MPLTKKRKRCNSPAAARKASPVLNEKAAQLLQNLKLDTSLCDEREIKKIEDISSSVGVSELLPFSESVPLSLLGAHVLYDKISQCLQHDADMLNIEDMISDVLAHDKEEEEEEEAEEAEEEEEEEEALVTETKFIEKDCKKWAFERVVEWLSSNTGQCSNELMSVLKLVQYLCKTVHDGACPMDKLNIVMTPDDFMALAKPFLNRGRSPKASSCLDFLLVRRFLPGIRMLDADKYETSTDDLCSVMDRVDRWFEKRPALARFLDPPCVVVEPLGAPLGGLTASMAEMPAALGAAPLPDGLGGGTWGNTIQCPSRSSAMAIAASIRARHPGPGGVGGAVAGSAGCRIMYFSMTAANHVEF